MAGKSTWRPHDTHGRLSEAKEASLPDSAFAFPMQRKSPLTAASYVVDAIAQFSDVEDVSDEDRDLAFENIRRAAAHYHVEMDETDWRQFRAGRHKPGHSPSTRPSS